MVGLHYIRKHSRWLACCQISTIWVSSKKFQKSNIGWPLQPPTEKILKFNMEFYVTIKTFLFTKHQNEASLVLKLLNSRTWLPDPDGLIFPGTKMTNTGPFLWNGSSKMQFFSDIWYFLCRRLLRPVYVTFLNFFWWNSNGGYLATC